MDRHFKKYLKDNKFEKQLKTLESQLKNKSIIIYGAGTLFDYISRNFSLEKLNIIGISDMKFSNAQEHEIYNDYPIIPKTSIGNYNPDCILVATENYFRIIEGMENNTNLNNIEIRPLVKKGLKEILQYVWDNI